MAHEPQGECGSLSRTDSKEGQLKAKFGSFDAFRRSVSAKAEALLDGGDKKEPFELTLRMRVTLPLEVGGGRVYLQALRETFVADVKARALVACKQRNNTPSAIIDNLDAFHLQNVDSETFIYEGQKLSDLVTQKVKVLNLILHYAPPTTTPQKKGSGWVDESSVRICMDPTCLQQFTTMVRRHRCRLCGDIFCADCAPKRPIPFRLRLQEPGLSRQTSARFCRSCLAPNENKKLEESEVKSCMRKSCITRFDGVRVRYSCHICGLIFCTSCCVPMSSIKKNLSSSITATTSAAAAASASTTAASASAASSAIVPHTPAAKEGHDSGLKVCTRCLRKPATLSDVEIIELFEERVVSQQVGPLVQQQFRALPTPTKRSLLLLHLTELAKAQGPRFIKFPNEPKYWVSTLGTDTQPPRRWALASQLERLRSLLLTAEECWVEEFLSLTGIRAFTRLLAQPDETIQRTALACLQVLVGSRVGLEAVLATSKVAEHVVTMLFLSPHSQIECLQLLNVLCWSSSEGCKSVVEGLAVVAPKARFEDGKVVEGGEKSAKKFQALVDLLRTPRAKDPNVKLLLQVLRLVNVMMIRTSPETERLKRQQELQAAGLNLSIISQLEQMCLSKRSESGVDEPLYELELQCLVFRKRALLGVQEVDSVTCDCAPDENSYWAEMLDNLPLDADATRVTRARLTHNLRRNHHIDKMSGGGGEKFHLFETFEFPKPQHSSLPSLIEAMARRVPRNTIVKNLLTTAMSHKVQLSEMRSNKINVPIEIIKNFPPADNYLLEEISNIFSCNMYNEEEIENKWKCMCIDEEDCANSAEVSDSRKNECVICALKCFLVEGGLNYLVAWWNRELEVPARNSGNPLPPIDESVVRFHRKACVHLIHSLWSLANVLELDLLSLCPSFHDITATFSVTPDQGDSRWLAQMSRVAPLSPLRLVSRGGFLSSLLKAARAHLLTHSLPACMGETFISLLTTGSTQAGPRGSKRATAKLAVPAALPFVLGVVPAALPDVGAATLRTVMGLLKEESGHPCLALIIQGLSEWSVPIQLEALRGLVDLLKRDPANALTCGSDHPTWLEDLQTVLIRSAGHSDGVYGLTLSCLTTILHKHFISEGPPQIFGQMFVDSLFIMGLKENDSQSDYLRRRHTWSVTAISMCRQIIDLFVNVLMEGIHDWGENSSHPAWAKFVCFLSLIKRLCLNNTESSDFLTASHFMLTSLASSSAAASPSSSPASSTSPPVSLISPLSLSSRPSLSSSDLVTSSAVITLACLLERLSLEESNDAGAVEGLEQEQEKAIIAIREECRLYEGFFQIAARRERQHSTSISIPLIAKMISRPSTSESKASQPKLSNSSIQAYATQPAKTHAYNASGTMQISDVHSKESLANSTSFNLLVSKPSPYATSPLAHKPFPPKSKPPNRHSLSTSDAALFE